jgi:hypothetical protein
MKGGQADVTAMAIEIDRPANAVPHPLTNGDGLDDNGSPRASHGDTHSA